jgi:uncharacterized protein involved in exopolysaccharide biosynthesis
MSPENLQYPEQDPNEISLKEFFLFIRRQYRFICSKWRIVFFVALLGGLLGLTYAFLKKPVYTATTTFVLESTENLPSLGQYAGLASLMGFDANTGSGIFQGNNILELYRSRTMIENTLLTEVSLQGKRLLLIDRYVEINKLREKWAEKKHLKNIRFQRNWSTLPQAQLRLQDSLLGAISNDINNNYLVVNKPDKNNLIHVAVTSEDEFFAKAFNDEIVANVNDFYVQTKTRKSLVNVSILQTKADSIRRTMERSIYSAAAVADATPNLNPTKQLQRNAPIQRSQFSAETNKAILAELVKNLEMSKMNLLRETPLIQVVDHPKYPLDISLPGKITSFIKGMLLFGFLAVLLLLMRKLISEVMA